MHFTEISFKKVLIKNFGILHAHFNNRKDKNIRRNIIHGYHQQGTRTLTGNFKRGSFHLDCHYLIIQKYRIESFSQKFKKKIFNLNFEICTY